MANETEKIVPPYIPVETFLELIKHFKQVAVPGRVDKSAMPSGWPTLTRGQAQSALRFLRLIDDKGNPAPGLQEIVHAFETPQWETAIKKNLLSPYSTIVGDLSLASATQHQLDERFAKVGVNGQMLPKSIRFYLAILKAGGVPFSPHLLAKRTSTQPRKRPSAKKPVEAAVATTTKQQQSPAPPPPKNHESVGPEMRTYPLYFKNKSQGSLIVPADLTAADCEVIDMQLKVLRLIAESS